MDTVLLAQKMTQVLRRPFSDARIVDRGAYASVYQLIDDISAKFPPSRALTPVLIRVSSRPVYNDVAIDQERQKITTYVATLNLIHASAPKQVLRRLPRVLAYDASSSSEFGHGWIAMTRVPGTPLAECWVEFDLEQRKKCIEELASFTRKLARFKSSHAIGSVSTATERATSLGISTSSSQVRTPLSLPGRNGANNLRPFNHSTPLSKSEHQSTASFLACAVESEIAFLRQHQKPAVRCFNVNIARLYQCDMGEEIPLDATFGSTTSATYKKQLRALGDLAQEVVSSTPSSERFVLAHLDLTPENILVEPETGTVTGVVDWEFSGFVPDWLALAPPSWVSNDWLPSWSGSHWNSEGDLSELDPFKGGREYDTAQSALLRALWEKEVTRNAAALSAAQQKAQDKRKMWKACMSEWHQLERACAWAKGIVTSRICSQVDGELQRSQVDLSYSDSEATHDDTDYRPRCNSPSTAESSTGPYTPIDAVSTRDLPFLQPPMGEAGFTAKEKERSDLKLALEFMSRQSSDDGDDEADEDDEVDGESDGDGDEVVPDDFDFEEFAMAFAPPPLPHIAPLTVTITQPSPQSPVTSHQTSFESFESSPGATPINSKCLSASLPTEEKYFLQYINSKAPPSRLPPGSLWGVFWEVPKSNISRDLDFVIERDLDAGW